MGLDVAVWCSLRLVGARLSPLVNIRVHCSSLELVGARWSLLVLVGARRAGPGSLGFVNAYRCLWVGAFELA